MYPKSIKTLLIASLTFLTLSVSLAQDFGDYSFPATTEDPRCMGYIKESCCCTNGACWETEAENVQPIGEPGKDEWSYIPTGHSIKRTGWSKGNKAVVCAYSQGWKEDSTKLGPGNPLSCIYPVPTKNLY